MDLDLSLAPGEISDLIRVDNVTSGAVVATVIADDNCYSFTLSRRLEFPDPATGCP